MIISVDNLHSRIIPEQKDIGNPIRFLSKELRVKVPKSNFVRAENFDGYVRFVSKKGQFLTGFISEVIRFAEGDFEITIVDNRGTIRPPEGLEFEVANKSLWEHQTKSIEKCLNNIVAGIQFPRGIIEAATNAGKSLMITSIVRSVAQKTLVVVHRKVVFNELYKPLKAEFGDQLGIVAEKKFEPGLVTLVMVKTFCNAIQDDPRIKVWLSNVQVVIADESHRAEHIEILKLVPAPYRFLFSGTHSEIRDPVAKARAVGLSGPVIVKIKNQELIDKGLSQRPIVKIYLNKIPVRDTWHIEYEDKYNFGIVRAEQRLQVLADYIEDNPDKHILIAVKFKKHGKLISRFLDVPYIDGDSRDRDLILQQFEKGEIKILTSTVILQESANLPLINALFFMIGEYSAIAVKQFVGRAIRTDGIHKTVDIIDFFDQDYGPLRKHSKERIKIYKKEGFEIQYMYDATPTGEPKKA